MVKGFINAKPKHTIVTYKLLHVLKARQNFIIIMIWDCISY